MRVRRKWRPSLGLLIAAVVGFLVVLPFVALVAARVTSNQFVRQTEASLHAQAALFATLYAEAYRGLDPDADGAPPLPDAALTRYAEDFHPIEPALVAATGAILPPRPDPRPGGAPPGETHQLIAPALRRIATQTQKTTLAGFLLTDGAGTIIAGSGEETGNLAHVPEVARALDGEIAAAARWRREEYGTHSLRSISRDTKFRVFVAHPVIAQDRIVGTVYLSRTPSNLNKYLFQQREALGWMFGGVALAALLVGLFLWRFLTRPLRALQDQAADIAAGSNRERLQRYGVREIASLGQSIMDMGAGLRRQASAIESYTKHATHELKSPVTSIMGAAELLEAPDASPERRAKLASAIRRDAARMDRLLNAMREMARGQSAFDARVVDLTAATAPIVQGFPDLAIRAAGATDTPLPLPGDAVDICLRHLVENAAEHGATEVVLGWRPEDGTLSVTDNGDGLSEASARQALEPFFTTKRERGGTGMGLAICAEVAAQFGGTVEITDTGSGAQVILRFADV